MTGVLDIPLTFLIPYIENVIIGIMPNLAYDKCKSLVSLLEKKDFESIFNNAINRNFKPDRLTEADIYSIKIAISKYNLTDFSEFDTETFKNKLSKDVYDNLISTDCITFIEFDTWFKAYLDDIRYFVIVALSNKEKAKNIVELDFIFKIKKDLEIIRENTRQIDNLVNLVLIPDGVRIIKTIINKASKEDIKQYYDGAPLTWEIVASDTGIIERDAYKQLVKEWIPPTDVINMICIVGDAGEGKSSLAWKFIYDLAQKKDSLILQIKDIENPEIWYRFENIYNQKQKPLIVLVDNVFRNKQVVAAMQSMEVLHIPITILATSRTNEYRERAHLPFPVKKITLNNPSYEEKKRILEELEKNEMKFGNIKKDLLEESVPFLVFMIQVTHGKKFEDYIEDEIKILQTLDPVIYKAYQFLCISYQYEISIPKSLFERIDKDFYNIENEKCHPASRGMILTDDIHVDNLRTRHPLISKYSAEYFNQINILIDTINVVDTKSSVERKFIIYLFREMANAGDSNLFKILKRYENLIEEYHKNATISEMSYWRYIYKNINLEDRASRCVDIALSKYPEGPLDCIWLAKFYQEKKEEIKALPKIQEWLAVNPQDNFVRPAYLKLVERLGTPEQKKKVTTDTETWLSENPKDSSVRPAYLGLVERLGTPEQKKKAITDTETWLSNNPVDFHVRPTYLGLVERLGTPEQKKKVIGDTEKWLSENPMNSNVRSAYLGLLGRIGTPEQKKKVTTDTETWLSENPKDSSVRPAYLGLVERLGTPEQKKKAITDTETWLSNNPVDFHVRPTYLGLVERLGTPEQKKKAITDTETWLLNNHQDNSVRPAYLGLVERLGTPEQKKKAIIDTETWLSENPNQGNIWELLISWLIRDNNLNKAIEMVKAAIEFNPNYANLLVYYLRLMQNITPKEEVKDLYKQLFDVIPGDVKNKNHYANWLRDNEYIVEAEQLYKALIKQNPRFYNSLYGYGCLLLKLERFKEASEKFREVLKIHKGHALAHERLAVALIGLEKFDEAENELRSALYWAKIAKSKLGIFYYNFGLLYLKQKRFKDAEFAFKKSISEEPENFANYWHLGETYFAQKDYQNSEQALLVALEKAPIGFGPPASEDIDKLLKECKKNFQC